MVLSVRRRKLSADLQLRFRLIKGLLFLTFVAILGHIEGAGPWGEALSNNAIEHQTCQGICKKTSDRRKRNKLWSLPEVVKLVNGISQFGVGKWIAIRRIFFSSSSLDIRDRWRNLLRASYAQLMDGAQVATTLDRANAKDASLSIPKVFGFNDTMKLNQMLKDDSDQVDGVGKRYNGYYAASAVLCIMLLCASAVCCPALIPLQAFLDMIERDLFHVHMKNVTYLRLDGSVETEKRFEIVKAFNSDPTIDALLLTTHVGGLGLNLTSTDTLIFMEHDWNPMRDLQV
ncbi:btaf1 RNA polymerase II, B-TFIID transcription factor-associated, 170kDa [Dionaea muscipula]